MFKREKLNEVMIKELKTILSRYCQGHVTTDIELAIYVRNKIENYVKGAKNQDTTTAKVIGRFKGCVLVMFALEDEEC